MRWWIGFDNTERTVYWREIDPKAEKFRLPPARTLLRISFGCSALLLAAAGAYYFEQLVVMGIALSCAVFVALWQILVYGYAPEDERALDATAFYGKGTLIFFACFWTLLIAGVAIALYLKAHAL